MSEIKYQFSRHAPTDAVTIHLVSDAETALALHPDGEKTLMFKVTPGQATRRKFVLLARAVIVEARARGISRLALSLADFNLPRLRIPLREKAAILAVNFAMANYEFVKYKTAAPDTFRFVREIYITGNTPAHVRRAFVKGAHIGETVNAARELTNTAANTITPATLAKEAMRAGTAAGIQVKVLKKPELKKLNMRGVLEVAKGSAESPVLIVMEYRRGGKKPPVALIGKAITFDSGGLNLKQGNGILPTSFMHMDMAGGAAVIHTLCLAARLKLNTNIVGIIPTAENMPSGSSYRPGDIIAMMDGTTVEVLNTDAEGRLLLADTLTYAERFRPRLTIDIATLTGSSLLTFGHRASAFFTEHESLARLIAQAGERAGDYVWRLPLWEEYATDIKGTFADIANAQKGKSAGAIAGAMFLRHFARNLPAWAHLDIAPRMIAPDDEYLARGATGTPVRLLIDLLETYR